MSSFENGQQEPPRAHPTEEISLADVEQLKRASLPTEDHLERRQAAGGALRGRMMAALLAMGMSRGVVEVAPHTINERPGDVASDRVIDKDDPHEGGRAEANRLGLLKETLASGGFAGFSARQAHRETERWGGMLSPKQRVETNRSPVDTALDRARGQSPEMSAEAGLALPKEVSDFARLATHKQVELLLTGAYTKEQGQEVFSAREQASLRIDEAVDRAVLSVLAEVNKKELKGVEPFNVDLFVTDAFAQELRLQLTARGEAERSSAHSYFLGLSDRANNLLSFEGEVVDGGRVRSFELNSVVFSRITEAEYATVGEGGRTNLLNAPGSADYQQRLASVAVERDLPWIWQHREELVRGDYSLRFIRRAAARALEGEERRSRRSDLQSVVRYFSQF